MAAVGVTHPCDAPRQSRPVEIDLGDLHVASGKLEPLYHPVQGSPPLSRTLAPTIKIAVTENGDRFLRLRYERQFSSSARYPG
jgi:hypothetical protein